MHLGWCGQEHSATQLSLLIFRVKLPAPNDSHQQDVQVGLAWSAKPAGSQHAATTLTALVATERRVRIFGVRVPARGSCVITLAYVAPSALN
jgi:hypothetical protein